MSEEIHVAELKAHVYRLASAGFAGRRGAGAKRAADHIAAAFKTLRLKPAFGESYLQPIPWSLAESTNKDQSFIGNNVGAMIEGNDPKLKHEWILLTCHLDHLGRKGATFFPGADDNATGCAMVMEVAERFALQKGRARRTIVFVVFDQEETGLWGSKHFAGHPPLPIKNLKGFFTADMIGRSMGNVMDEYVFALGSENSFEIRKLLEENPPRPGLKVGRVGADMIGTRSDYGPFRDRKIPFVFFSTGQHPDYHTVRDTPDKIDYEKLGRISNWIFELTAKLADAEHPPRWAKDGLPPDLDEVATIHLLLSRVLQKAVAYGLTEKQQKLVQSTCDKLNLIVKKKIYTTTERATLIWTARLLMASVF